MDKIINQEEAGGLMWAVVCREVHPFFHVFWVSVRFYRFQVYFQMDNMDLDYRKGMILVFLVSLLVLEGSWVVARVVVDNHAASMLVLFVVAVLLALFLLICLVRLGRNPGGEVVTDNAKAAVILAFGILTYSAICPVAEYVLDPSYDGTTLLYCVSWVYLFLIVVLLINRCIRVEPDAGVEKERRCLSLGRGSRP